MISAEHLPSCSFRSRRRSSPPMAGTTLQTTTTAARFAPIICFPRSRRPSVRPERLLQCNSSLSALPTGVRAMVDAFDPAVPLRQAVTPPSLWYTDACFLEEEYDRVFFQGWQAVGFSEQIENPGDFFTGRLGNLQFVICRDAKGVLHAFHNVCRHHASLLVSGSGQCSCFVCPYHGWTYNMDGALLKATHITGIQNFNLKEFALVPLKVATWGPFILVCFNNDKENMMMETVGNEWLGDSSEILSTSLINAPLKHVCRREYTIECNWKVFCDNYLDGGYHVPYAHRELASGVTMNSYSTSIFGKVSIQSCECALVGNRSEFDRLGSKALYVFIYPNFMINRYGPWMDTNLVLPLGPRKCHVIFDYFLDPYLKGDEEFISRSLEESERVQLQDIVLCEGVQKGLESPAYSTGRYAPSVEKAMHHFHCLLHHSLNRDHTDVTA